MFRPMPILALGLALGAAAGVAARAPAPDALRTGRAGAGEAVAGGYRAAGYRAAVVRVVDGDTFEARVAVWPDHAVTTRVRLAGVDAPEMSSRCARGRRAAQVAKRALAEILAGGEVVLLDVRPDKYFGRVVARAVSASGVDAGARLLERGLAVPYRGGRRGGSC